MASTYQPKDQLYLWWLGDPGKPRLVGDLDMVRSLRGVSLRYDSSWMQHGFALSEDLPLSSEEHLPTERDQAPGAVDDARPDRWGERVIRFVEKPSRLSLLEYLYFAGDDRFGALGVSTLRETYAPRELGPLPVLSEVERLHELVEMVLNNEAVPERERRLIAPGGTLGGARPKALLQLEGESWVVKFADGDVVDTPLVEHAAMTLAAKAGIRVAKTRPIRLIDGHAVAIRRYDREGSRRLHALTANVALKATGQGMGYPELAQLLRRKGESEHAADDMRELFRRMVFNILIDNTDDHEKNHALLVTDAQLYRLSPAYDVLPSGQALGYQQMRVGSEEADSTLSNAYSMASHFGLKPKDAREEATSVAKVVSGWQAHFLEHGVGARDLETLAEQVDRPFLRDQREHP